MTNDSSNPRRPTELARDAMPLHDSDDSERRSGDRIKSIDRDEQTLYKFQLPWGWKWTDRYGIAFQSVTGMTIEEAGGSHPNEDKIRAFGVSAREVECVYCDAELSESRISEHHVEEHPMERYNPAYYAPEDSQEDIREVLDAF